MASRWGAGKQNRCRHDAIRGAGRLAAPIDVQPRQNRVRLLRAILRELRSLGGAAPDPGDQARDAIEQLQHGQDRDERGDRAAERCGLQQTSEQRSGMRTPAGIVHAGRACTRTRTHAEQVSQLLGPPGAGTAGVRGLEPLQSLHDHRGMQHVKARVRADSTRSRALPDGGCALLYELEVLDAAGLAASVERAELWLTCALRERIDELLRAQRANRPENLPGTFALLAIEALRGAAFTPGEGFAPIDLTPKHLMPIYGNSGGLNNIAGATAAFDVVELEAAGFAASGAVRAVPPPAARPAGAFPPQA